MGKLRDPASLWDGLLISLADRARARPGCFVSIRPFEVGIPENCIFERLCEAFSIYLQEIVKSNARSLHSCSFTRNRRKTLLLYIIYSSIVG